MQLVRGPGRGAFWLALTIAVIAFAIALGIGETLEHNDPDTISRDRPAGIGVKSAAISVRRENAAFFINVTTLF